MFPSALPYDLVQYIDPGDRVRRTRARPIGIRVRRAASRG